MLYVGPFFKIYVYVALFLENVWLMLVGSWKCRVHVYIGPFFWECKMRVKRFLENVCFISGCFLKMYVLFRAVSWKCRDHVWPFLENVWYIWPFLENVWCMLDLFRKCMVYVGSFLNIYCLCLSVSWKSMFMSNRFLRICGLYCRFLKT